VEESEVYPEKLTAHGLAYVRPKPEEREEINRIIMDELVCSVFKPEAVAYHQRVIERLKSEGCDAVILGCTEIPLILNDSNSPLPTLDSTRLPARAALQRALHGYSKPNLTRHADQSPVAYRNWRPFTGRRHLREMPPHKMARALARMVERLMPTPAELREDSLSCGSGEKAIGSVVEPGR
jgi:hypothetical protein